MRIGFIIVGAAGYMGLLGLDAVARLRRKRHNVSIDVVAAVDTTKNAERQAALVRKLEELGYDGGKAPIGQRLDIGLVMAAEYRAALHANHADDTVLIAYDASPTTAHADNLRSIASSGLHILYLGEKPSFFDMSDVDYFRTAGQAFLCNFIEAANPAFRAMVDHISANDLGIREMWFWRAGDMGLRHATGRGRRGVEGGSLFDKAVHDVAISVALLSPRRLASFEIERANIECFQLCELDPPTFVSMNQAPSPLFGRREIASALDPLPVGTRVGRDQFPADAAFTLDLRWMLDGPAREAAPPVPAHYLSSWLGYLGRSVSGERRMLAKLRTLGVRPRAWREEVAHQHDAGDRGICEYQQQEARIGILDCMRPDGTRESLVCDFLGSKFGAIKPRSCQLITGTQEGGDFSRRCIYPRTAAERRYEATTYGERALDGLAAIFESAVDHAVTGVDVAAISQHGALRVHEVLIRAQEHALKTANFAMLKRKSIRLFGGKVTFTPSPVPAVSTEAAGSP
jgi:predicted dehydrogenase